MEFFNYFRAIHGSLNMPNKTETKRRKARTKTEKYFPESLDVDEFLYWDKVITDEATHLNIYNNKFSSVIGHQQEFTCLMDEKVQIGNILYNPIDNQYWLIMDIAPIDRIYKKGLMYRCNGFLRWQDKNGAIWEYPYHDINSTQYNSGTEQGRNVDFGSSQHKITTTADENTLCLTLDKRFFLGRNTALPDVYKLSQNDTSSQNFDKGMVSLTLLKDEYSPDTDDIEKWLCDVRGRRAINTKESGDLLMKFNSPKVRAGGTKTITVTGANDILWNVEAEEPLKSSITLTAFNNSCKIKVKSAIEFVGKSFILHCRSDSLDKTVSQEFEVTGGV